MITQPPQFDWHRCRKLPRFILSSPWREWVLEEGSLTRRLQQASGGDFRVKLVKHCYEVPRQDERKLLQLPMRQCALVREVELICRNETWVTARSIIPLHTLTGAERELAHLGERPLGGFLFASRAMHRGPFEVGKKQTCDSANNLSTRLWARRSVFFLHEKPLLVSEYFEPALFMAQSHNGH
ncbi:MAG: chorismate lyase [Hahellaceae bacterium]|nr:chorismate lyase [Hahellaceae bacterium]MCP5210736.1 chorismate lyase [Hahellaceae bacterium]